MKSLLLGNGLNIANNNSFLSNEEIKKRFLKNLKDEIKTIENLLNIENIDYDDLKLRAEKETGIEQMSGAIFEQFRNILEKQGKMDWLQCNKIIQILGVISIKSIFIVDGKFRKPKIYDCYVKKIHSYRRIFTLNYIETWDIKNNCNYLHGNVKNDLGCYDGQYITTNTLNLNSFINRKKEPKIFLNLTDIVFIPNNKIVTKQEYVGNGLFPNKCGLSIYPGNDLFPYGGKGDIYSDLADVNDLEIFGVSPYGDQSLIDKIKNIDNIKIYVYDIERNKKEVCEWKKYFPNATFADSGDFLKV